MSTHNISFDGKKQTNLSLNYHKIPSLSVHNRNAIHFWTTGILIHEADLNAMLLHSLLQTLSTNCLKLMVRTMNLKSA